MQFLTKTVGSHLKKYFKKMICSINETKFFFVLFIWILFLTFGELSDAIFEMLVKLAKQCNA